MIERNALKVALFQNVEDKELEALLSCLDAKKVSYRKNQMIYQEEDKITKVGILLSGKIHIVKDDLWGNRTILAGLLTGDMFGEAFSCAGEEKIPANVIAVEDTEVLMIDYKRILTTCSASCSFHTQLIKNMLTILGKKNLQLTQKVEHLTKRTTKDKVLSYLSSEAKRQGKNSFDIPFNRQELADYLAVDRSAMSNELSKMKEEGILTFERSHFELV
ncbi:MAG: Crp/Fnr family transcriptional regulator [Eubacteriales bacterium]|nr:Crp/Fnr family transcriptional regulator [Eubacteriales bacterium]